MYNEPFSMKELANSLVKLAEKAGNLLNNYKTLTVEGEIEVSIFNYALVIGQFDAILTDNEIGQLNGEYQRIIGLKLARLNKFDSLLDCVNFVADRSIYYEDEYGVFIDCPYPFSKSEVLSRVYYLFYQAPLAAESRSASIDDTELQKFNEGLVYLLTTLENSLNRFIKEQIK